MRQKLKTTFERVEEKSREITVRKRICSRIKMSFRSKTKAQPLPRMWPLALRLRIWRSQNLGIFIEFYFDVKTEKEKKKSIETIEMMRGILLGKNDLFLYTRGRRKVSKSV